MEEINYCSRLEDISASLAKACWDIASHSVCWSPPTPAQSPLAKPRPLPCNLTISHSREQGKVLKVKTWKNYKCSAMCWGVIINLYLRYDLLTKHCILIIILIMWYLAWHFTKVVSFVTVFALVHSQRLKSFLWNWWTLWADNRKPHNQILTTTQSRIQYNHQYMVVTILWTHMLLL